MSERYPEKRGARDVYEPLEKVYLTRQTPAARKKAAELRAWLEADAEKSLTGEKLSPAEKEELKAEIVAGLRRQSWTGWRGAKRGA